MERQTSQAEACDGSSRYEPDDRVVLQRWPVSGTKMTCDGSEVWDLKTIMFFMYTHCTKIDCHYVLPIAFFQLGKFDERLPVGSALELLILNDLNPVVVGVLEQVSDREHRANSASYLPRMKATFFILPSVKRFFHETFFSSKRLQAASKSSTETQVWPTKVK